MIRSFASIFLTYLCAFSATNSGVGDEPAKADKPRLQVPIAIVHVGVIDVVAGKAIADQTVIVEGAAIRGVGNSASADVPRDARVIDGVGKYVIPGLWDMHVHSADTSTLPLFVANGITGVRVMWGNPGLGGLLKQHFTLRERIERGNVVGPKLVVASNIMDGAKPIWPGSLSIKTEADARDAVQKAKNEGADFIKVYSGLGRAEYLAIADESRKLGIPFAGHVPYSVSAAVASDAGQKSLEHLFGIRLGCSREEDEMISKREDILKNAKILEFFKTLLRQEAESERSRDPARAGALFEKFKKNGTFVCPTLTVLEATSRLDDEQFIADPRLKYMSSYIRAFWDPRINPVFHEMKPEDYIGARKHFTAALQLTGELHRAGVSLLAGTDEMNPYCFPGFSLHDELALLTRAGLTPADSLRCATINPARFLGIEAKRGTIEPGKVADLVLLDANPLEKIGATKAIRAVVLAGKLFERDDLDRILAKAEAEAQKKPAPTPR